MKPRSKFSITPLLKPVSAGILFYLVAGLVMSMPSSSRAQSSAWDRTGDTFGWYWGQAKTGVIKSAIGGWNKLAGNSCGDFRPETMDAIRGQNACPTQSGLKKAIETAFFNSGVKMQLADERCSMLRYQTMAGAAPKARQAITEFTNDLKTKLADLRKLYSEIQSLKADLGQKERTLLARDEGGIPASMVDYYLRSTKNERDLLEKRTGQLNALVFSNPLAHFEDGQKLLYDLVARKVEPTEANVRAAYTRAFYHVKDDSDHLRSRAVPGQSGQYNLSRTDKVFLMDHGKPETWFNSDKTSTEEANRVVCNFSRVYQSGETVANTALTIGSYALGAEGYLVKVAFAAKIASVFARARRGLISLETMNMMSWGLTTTSAIDSAVRQCGMPKTPVGRSGPQCQIDPDQDRLMMQDSNCALGVAMAAGSMAFTAATTALGKRALDRAVLSAKQRFPQVVTPIRTVTGKFTTKSSAATRAGTKSAE